MGTCLSLEVDEAKLRSKRIDKLLLQDQLRMKNVVKVLLLGSGESGKSTIVKQMTIIHQGGFSDAQRRGYRHVIYKNVLDSMQAVIIYMRRVGQDFIDYTNRSLAEKVLDYRLDSREHENPYFAPEIAEAIELLSKDAIMTTILNEHQSNFYLMDSAEYYFGEIKRIATPGFIPNNNDILRARRKSIGITEVTFPSKQVLIHMFDVGGQRSERKKWIHCFESVTSIIFCTSLSEYDQVLLEEKSQNRMAESLVLFQSIVNSRWFLRTSIILFLNKIDILEKKIVKVPLERYLPDYTGEKDSQKATEFILYKFMQTNTSQLNVYSHVTNAINTDNITLVFSVVRETILQNALKDSGVL